LRGGSNGKVGKARADGPHQTGGSCGAYLVFQISSQLDRLFAGDEFQEAGEHHLL